MIQMLSNVYINYRDMPSTMRRTCLRALEAPLSLSRGASPKRLKLKVF